MFIMNNDYSAVCCDHTYMDGVTYLAILERINDEFLEDKDIKINKDIVPVKAHAFTLDKDTNSTLVKFKNDFIKYMNNISYDFLDLEFVNKSILKKNKILSSDGFAHTAFYLAQRKT